MSPLRMRLLVLMADRIFVRFRLSSKFDKSKYNLINLKLIKVKLILKLNRHSKAFTSRV